MLNSNKKSLLIEVYFNNASTYSNSTYGMVNGVMRLVHASKLSFTYNSNVYKAGILYSINEFENSVDLLGKVGGYEPFNEFGFEIVDEGLYSDLISNGINFLNAQIVCRPIIDSSVYQACYYGCCNNVSTIDQKIKIVCGDISKIKESISTKPVILGAWNENSTNRYLSLDPLSSDVTPSYGIVFPQTTGSPDENTFDDYNANKQAYETIVKSVDVVGGVFTIGIYAEALANITSNSNYNTYNAYMFSLLGYNIEVIGSSGETKEIYPVYGYAVGYEYFYVYGDSTSLVPNKTKIRFAKSSVVTNYTTWDLQTKNNINGFANLTPLFSDDGNNLMSSDNELFVPSSDGKKIMNAIIPTGNESESNNLKFYDFSAVQSASYFFTQHKTNFNASDFNFEFSTLNDSCKVATIDKPSGTAIFSSIYFYVDIDSDFLYKKDWSIGFKFALKNNLANQITMNDVGTLKLYTSTGIGIAETELELESCDLENNAFYYDSVNTYHFGAGVLLNDSAMNPVRYNVLKSLADSIDFKIDPQYFIGKTIKLRFSIGIAPVNSDVAQADLYCQAFYLYDDEISDFEDLQIYKANGATWATNPKYTGGAGTDIPMSRTEMVRYLLDQFGSYTPSTDYIGDIFLSPTQDEFAVAFDNFERLDNNLTDLIDYVLSGSSFKLLGNALGKRMMIDLKQLAGVPSTVSRAFVGSFKDVNVNGFYDGVSNSYKLTFDKTLNYSPVFNNITGDIEYTTNAENISQSSSETLITALNDSVFFTTPSDVKEITSDLTNFGSVVCYAPKELSNIAMYLAWPMDKFAIYTSLKSYFDEPVYIGQWISFRDLKYTNDGIIYGLIQGVKVDFDGGLVSISCVTNIKKPPATILNEQNGGYILSEQLPSVNISEQGA